MSELSAMVVEIRIPTYRQPVLLERALMSLKAQSYNHWKAFVLEDSPDNACNEILHMIESQGLKESIDRASLRYFIKNSSSVFSLVFSRGFAEKKQIIKNIALKWMC